MTRKGAGVKGEQENVVVRGQEEAATQGKRQEDAENCVRGEIKATVPKE